jgi:hypothetical protein
MRSSMRLSKTVADRIAPLAQTWSMPSSIEVLVSGSRSGLPTKKPKSSKSSPIEGGR